MSSKSKKKRGAATGTWFEVVAHSDALAKNVVEIPGGQRYTVRGPIHEVMIITIPQQQIMEMMKAGTFDATMDALGTTVRGGGFEGGLLIVPEGLGYMKLQPVDSITAKLLEQRDQRQKAEHQAKVAKIKAEQDGEVEKAVCPECGSSNIDLSEGKCFECEHIFDAVPDNVRELRPDTKTMGEA